MRLALILFALILGAAYAQVDLDLGGEIRTDFGVVFRDHAPVDSLTIFDLTLSGEVGSGFFPDAAFDATLRARFDAVRGEMAVELRDAFATLFVGDFDLLIGQQTVSWGSADALNIVDVVNPDDLRNPFAGEKLPLPLLRAIYNGPGGLKVDAVVIPAFRASTQPASIWQIDTPPIIPPEGTTIVGQNPPRDNLPAAEFANVQFGARATYRLNLLKGADASIVYFSGIETTPTVTAEFIGEQEITVQPILNYDHYQLIAVDFSVGIGDTVLRGEAGYTFTKDPGGTDPAVGNPSFNAVLGTEYRFGDVTTIFQGNFDYARGDDGEQADLAFSVLATATYSASARLSLEGAWFQGFDGGGLIAPRASYTFADGVTGELSGSFFFGPEESRLGSFRSNSQLRTSLGFAF
ncbi:MAG: hypothetical protein JSV66_19345 [Trueperaceae bacterium]|nr:MAG: hypothetical protein JSV66_19345 [Trueperaceae bacterium]